MSTAAIPMERSKQRVALISVLAAVGIFVFKLLVGVHTRSIGILAEAAHSALDLLAVVFTWVTLRIAARPADANHPFGHGKFENFSAFIETGLLVLTALAIAGVAVGNWMSGRNAASVNVDGWAFAVMLTSIALDWSRSGILRRTAVKFHSDALAADALNFTTDMASSLAVLIGLVLVKIAEGAGIGWLLHADAVAALTVAAAMIWLALRLGRRTAGVLLDEAPPELLRELRAGLAGIDGAAGAGRLRLRRVGSRYFVDAALELLPATTLERAEVVKQLAADRIRQRLSDADVVIETSMRHPEPLGPFDHIQEIAQRQNLTIHDLSIYRAGPGLDVEFHLELAPQLPLAEAHNLVSRLETQMRQELPAIHAIVTHIEPEADRISAARGLESQPLVAQVQRLAAQIPGLLDCHDLQLRRSGGHLVLSCHCSFADTLPVAQVHERVTQLEAEIKRNLPQLFRVTIHPEPVSDNRR
ncbi:MAG: cation diffusion facilitator family transporter [Terriglobales bacterium]